MFRMVKTKLALIYGFYMFLILIVLFFTFMAFSQFSSNLNFLQVSQTEGIRSLNSAIRMAYETKEDSVSLILAERNNDSLANEKRRYIDEIKRIDVKNFFETFRSKILFEDQVFGDAEEQFMIIWQDWYDLYDEFLSLSYGDESGLLQAEYLLLEGGIQDKYLLMLDQLDILSVKAEGFLSQEANTITERFLLYRIILISMAGAILVLSVLQGFFFHYAIFRHVSGINNRLRRIAHGRGDLTMTLNVKNRDEFGILAKNFNSFIEYLRTNITAVKEVSEKNGVLNNDLSENNAEVSSAVTEISANLKNIKHTADNLDNIVEKAEKRITLISDEITRLDNQVDNQANQVIETSASIT